MGPSVPNQEPRHRVHQKQGSGTEYLKLENLGFMVSYTTVYWEKQQFAHWNGWEKRRGSQPKGRGQGCQQKVLSPVYKAAVSGTLSPWQRIWGSFGWIPFCTILGLLTFLCENDISVQLEGLTHFLSICGTLNMWLSYVLELSLHCFMDGPTCFREWGRHRKKAHYLLPLLSGGTKHYISTGPDSIRSLSLPCNSPA